MAFPIVVDYDTLLVSTNETSHSQPLPADRASGNLLLDFFTCDSADVDITIGTSTGWVELIQYNGSASTFGIYYKLSAADSAADDLSLTTDSAQHSASIMYAISGHDSSKVPDYSTANGNSTNADPPSLTTTRGRHDYLWFTCMGTDGTVVASAAPTDFSDLITYASASSADGVSISSAQRNYHTNNTAYNPGTFTSASAYWIAVTVAVVPLEGPGFGISSVIYRIT
jgi:hypothetical protein